VVEDGGWKLECGCTVINISLLLLPKRQAVSRVIESLNKFSNATTMSKHPNLLPKDAAVINCIQWALPEDSMLMAKHYTSPKAWRTHEAGQARLVEFGRVILRSWRDARLDDDFNPVLKNWIDCEWKTTNSGWTFIDDRRIWMPQHPQFGDRANPRGRRSEREEMIAL
jgi:hypothetical protein